MHANLPSQAQPFYCSVISRHYFSKVKQHCSDQLNRFCDRLHTITILSWQTQLLILSTSSFAAPTVHQVLQQKFCWRWHQSVGVKWCHCCSLLWEDNSVQSSVVLTAKGPPFTFQTISHGSRALGTLVPINRSTSESVSINFTYFRCAYLLRSSYRGMLSWWTGIRFSEINSKLKLADNYTEVKSII